jgi:hypothetical protein
LAGLTSFGSLNIMVTVLSVLASIVFWVALYRPLIRRLDQDIKDVRRLLLLLPDEVTRSIPSVVAAGRSMLMNSGASVGASLSGTAPGTANDADHDSQDLVQHNDRNSSFPPARPRSPESAST